MKALSNILWTILLFSLWHSGASADLYYKHCDNQECDQEYDNINKLEHRLKGDDKKTLLNTLLDNYYNNNVFNGIAFSDGVVYRWQDSDQYWMKTKNLISPRKDDVQFVTSRFDCLNEHQKKEFLQNCKINQLFKIRELSEERVIAIIQKEFGVTLSALHRGTSRELEHTPPSKKTTTFKYLGQGCKMM